MIKSNFLTSFICLMFCFIQPINAVPTSNKVIQENPILKEKKTKNKKGFFKKIKPIFNNKTNNPIRKKARLGLIFGIASFVALILSVASISAWGSGIPLVLAGILAILGDVFSISALRKIKKENLVDYIIERRHARLGLIFSLATGAIPLLILLLVFLIILFLG